MSTVMVLHARWGSILDVALIPWQVIPMKIDAKEEVDALTLGLQGRVGGLVFSSRSPLAGSTVAMKPHPGADREQKREERKQREAQMKGHKKLPTTLPYFRRSFHGVRATNGQLRRIALIYGEENAEAFVTRFQWAIDLMIVYDPAISDWEKKKRQLAGLG